MKRRIISHRYDGPLSPSIKEVNCLSSARKGHCKAITAASLAGKGREGPSEGLMGGCWAAWACSQCNTCTEHLEQTHVPKVDVSHVGVGAQVEVPLTCSRAVSWFARSSAATTASAAACPSAETSLCATGAGGERCVCLRCACQAREE